MSKKNKKVRSPTATMPKRIVNSGYSHGGASLTNNVLKSFTPRSLSTISDIDMNLETLKNRSADLARNTPIGAAIIETSARGVIGQGLSVFARPKYKTLGITAEQAREWSKRVVEEFNLWSESIEADFYRRNNFKDLQSIVYQSYLIDGDSFALFRRREPTKLQPYSLQLQLIEANRISNPQNEGIINYSPLNVEAIRENGNRIVNGVETDKAGRLQAFWISNKVPNDMASRDISTTWSRVEAFGQESGMPNILQICRDIRANQYRGVPYIAPVIETLKQISRYTNAELTSAIIRTFFSLFFTETPSGMNGLNSVIPNTYDGDELRDPTEPLVKPSDYKLGPGTINALPAGVDVKSIDSSKQSAFAAFVTELLKQVGAAVGLPYETLMKCFNSSYSASRAALLQVNDEFKQRRAWFIRDFCKPVFNVWLAEAIAIGRIEAPGFFEDPLRRAAWSNVEFYGPAMSILDPVKDMQGSAAKIELGLSTRQKETAELTGLDYEENIEQLAYENQLRQELMLDEEMEQNN